MIALPSYIDPMLWAAFVEQRKAMKVPFTQQAQKLVVMKLMKMHAAIRSRTPEHQAAMEAGIQARIGADPCYFCAMGEADRARLARGEVPC